MDFTEGEKKQLMSAGRWNQSALKPHLVSNGKNIKDYYPRRQKGHQHLPRRAQAKFRRTISQGRGERKKNTVTAEHQRRRTDIRQWLFPFPRAIKNVHANWRPHEATFNERSACKHPAAGEVDVSH